MPLVSVVVPVYNGEKYLAQCLDSVLKQTMKDYELIVVNDGSRDSTAGILDRYRGIRVITHPRNRGVAKALNSGTEAAFGKYLCYLAYDDWWDPHKLEVELSYIEGSRFGVVYSDFYCVPENTSRFIQVNLLNYNPLSARFLKTICFLNISSSMVRKQCLDKLKLMDGYFFDESLPSCVDWDLWIRLSKGCLFKRVPVCLSYYRLHSGQMIRDKMQPLYVLKVQHKHSGSRAVCYLRHAIWKMAQVYIKWGRYRYR